MASVTLELLLRVSRTRLARWSWAYALGVRPVTALKTRWKWNRVIAAARATASRSGASSDRSMSRQARAIASARRAASERSFGRHRLHGRKPAASASIGVAWKETFSRFAGRDAHEGRQ